MSPTMKPFKQVKVQLNNRQSNLIKNQHQQLIRYSKKHHPDKNIDKQAAKIKFRQISEAYAVLNDPEKRKNYDIFGKQGLEFEGINFEQFAEDFSMFESFVDELLGFNDFEDILSYSKKKGKKKGRGGRSKKNKNEKIDMGSLDKMMGGMMQMMMLQSMMQGDQFDMTDLMNMDENQLQKYMNNFQNGKNKEEFNADDDEDDADEEDLTKEEYQILKFGEENVQRTKVGKKKKKTVTKCKFDKMEIEDDEILLHFSELHMKEFLEWQKNKM